MKNGRWQAKDVDDLFFLLNVWAVQNDPSPPWNDYFLANPWDHVHWTHTEDLVHTMPMFPESVLVAKAASLIKRGLLRGCTCGCRGDFELTHEALALLGIDAPGYNPVG